MKRFHSYEEFEQCLKNEKVPSTDLTKEIIATTITSKKSYKKSFLPKLVLISILILTLSIPVLAKGSQLYNSILNHFKGQILATLIDKEGNVTFEIAGIEYTEEEKNNEEIYAKHDSIRDEIAAQLEPGEVAIAAFVDIYDTRKSSFQESKPIEYEDMDGLLKALEDLELVISIPKYIPEEYEFQQAELRYTGFIDEDKLNELIEDARAKNKPYVWEKTDNKVLDVLRLIYKPKKLSESDAEWADYIYVDIDLNGSNSMGLYLKEYVNVEKVELRKKEVLQVQINDMISYIFKVDNRDYKNYWLKTGLDNGLSIKEIEKMIDSFE